MKIPPVLLLVFNRPDETKKVFEVIRLVKPKHLYIVADGPREGKNDERKCERVRSIVSTVDWDCSVKKLYREKNRGLEKGLGEAITWFFDQVESGIVLEDDCVPDETFFEYCAQMLERYKNDEHIMVVNGSSFLPTHMQNKDNYYYSKYVHFWGWASWRRAWRLFDPTMKQWPVFKESNDFRHLFRNRWERVYFTMIFDSTFLGKTNSWGYRWLYSVWLNNGKAISPGVNLIRNVGFTKDATHKVLRTFELPTDPITSIPKILSERESQKADAFTAQRYYAISPLMIAALTTFYLFKKK